MFMTQETVKFKDVLKAIDPTFSKRLITVFILVIITIVAEVASLGLVFPVVSFIIEGRSTYDLGHFSSSLNTVQVSGHLLILALVILFALKTVLLTFTIRQQSKFTYDLAAEVSHSLVQRYLQEDVSFLSKNHSAHLIRNITTEVNNFSGGFVMPVLFSITETGVIIAISCLILLTEPIAFLIAVTIFALPFYLFMRFARYYVNNLGKTRHNADGDRIQIFQEALNSIYELKIYNAGDYFSELYRQSATLSAAASGSQFFLNQIPRVWLEFLIVVGIGIIFFFLDSSGNSTGENLGVLAVFAVASVRVLPSLNRLNRSIQNISYNRVALNSIHTELSKKITKQTMPTPIETTDDIAIEFDGVSFSYKGEVEAIFTQLNFSIGQSLLVGISGESGAGKSTLIGLILGILQPCTGRIKYNKNILQPNNGVQVAYVPQDVAILNKSIRENVAYGSSIDEIDDKLVISALEQASLSHYVMNLSAGLDTILSEGGSIISGGQRQRIAIARALYRQPKLLVLDEATSALDKKTASEIITTIKNLKAKMTIIMITHDLNQIAQCEKVIELSNTSAKIRDI